MGVLFLISSITYSCSIMIRTNYHTHNAFCDGTGLMEDYVQAAKDKGFQALGFSSHAPIALANEWSLSEERLRAYLDEGRRLKQVHQGDIELYVGLEIDYIPGSQGPRDTRWDSLGLDYRIGSVHSTVGLDQDPEYRCIDGPVEGLEWVLENIHGGSVRQMCEAYYARVAELAQLGGFDILGHFDLIKKRNQDNRYFDEKSPWYSHAAMEALKAVAKSGVILEINTGAISRGLRDDPYPSPFILHAARKMEIPVTYSADAHAPAALDCSFDDVQDLLKDTGYSHVRVLMGGHWKDVAV